MTLHEFTNEYKSAVGKKLFQFRELLGYSRAEFSKLLKLSQSTIDNIEKGKGVSVNTLATYSFYSGADISEFINTKPNFTIAKSTISKLFSKTVSERNSEGWNEVLKMRNNLKNAIEKILKDGNFFKRKRTVSIVSDYLFKNFGAKYDSSIISQSLKTFVVAGQLKSELASKSQALYYI